MEMQSSQSSLLQKLVEAKLAGAKLPHGGYFFRSNEQAAERALAVFERWAKESGEAARVSVSMDDQKSA
jgi:hypothetical protein